MWFLIIFALAVKVGTLFDTNTWFGPPVNAPGGDVVAEQLKDCPWGNEVRVDEQGVWHCMDYTKHHWNTIYPHPMTCPGRETDVTCVPGGGPRFDEGREHGGH